MACLQGALLTVMPSPQMFADILHFQSLETFDFPGTTITSAPTAAGNAGGTW